MARRLVNLNPLFTFGKKRPMILKISVSDKGSKVQFGVIAESEAEQ